MKKFFQKPFAKKIQFPNGFSNLLVALVKVRGDDLMHWGVIWLQFYNHTNEAGVRVIQPQVQIVLDI